MTAETPAGVWFGYNIYLDAGSSPTGLDYPIPLSSEPGSIVVSEDMDRDSFVEVVLTLDWIDEDLFYALDPRTAEVGSSADGPVRMRIMEYVENAPDSPRAYLPIPVPGDDDSARLWPRTLTRDYIARTVRLTCTGREAIMDDALRIATSDVDTGATTVEELVAWSVNAVFGTTTMSHAAITASTSIPSGERRLMQPGGSHLGLIRSELDALNCRLYDYYGTSLFTRDRDTVLGDAIHLATAPDLQWDVDPIVWELTETLSRDGRWADGVIMEYDMTAYGGVVTFQASSGGASSSKGIVLRRGRPAPDSNAADNVKSRSLIRGRDLDVTARARLDVRSRRPIVVWTRDTYIEGSIRAVEWSFPEGTMRLKVQS